jgi:hypothetical protein
LQPGCGTFLDGSPDHTKLQASAGVGACKVTGCQHKDDFECMANSIDVAIQGDTAKCMTYHMR